MSAVPAPIATTIQPAVPMPDSANTTARAVPPIRATTDSTARSRSGLRAVTGSVPAGCRWRSKWGIACSSRVRADEGARPDHALLERDPQVLRGESRAQLGRLGQAVQPEKVPVRLVAGGW